MKTTLVIMAAGIGSRFGGGIKQLEKVGPNGEIIMDYSIYDALKAGFDKIVFIIRKDIEEPFREIIGNRVEKLCEVDYVFQESDNLPDGFTKPYDRIKPWGTGHAILCCKGVVNEPFAVINADDYYGREAFEKLHTFLVNEKDTSYDGTHDICLAGFMLKNTLSDNGGVTRGICLMDENMNLTGINETKNIVKYNGGIYSKDENDQYTKIPDDAFASMNMWGFFPSFIDYLEGDFVKFLSKYSSDLSKEFLLPIIVDNMLKNNIADIKVLKTNDKWFGITYKEDKESVSEELLNLANKGMYIF